MYRTPSSVSKTPTLQRGSEILVFGQRFVGKPKVLYIDLETSPVLGFSWGIYDTDIIKIVRNTEILCFSYKWEGEKTKVVSIRTAGDEKNLLQSLWVLMDSADVLIGHNSDRFDIKKINGRFFAHGFVPPRPFMTIDTLKILRKHLALDSNKQNDVARLMGLKEKVKHHGIETWLGCMNGDPKEWAIMEKYNKNDVDMLVKNFNLLLPWLTWKENKRKSITVKSLVRAS